MHVNPENNYTLMDSEIIQKFEKMLSEKLPSKQFSEEAVANVSRIFHEAIMLKDEEYKAAKEAQEQVDTEAKAESAQLVTDVEDLKEKLAAAESELTVLQEEKAATEAQETFNTRMAGLDTEFELQQQDREIVATEIQGLEPTKEAFASYQEKLRVMWSHKTKAFLEASEKELQDKIDKEVAQRLEELQNSTASLEEPPETEEVLDSADEEASNVVTNNNAEAAQDEPSLRDKFRAAFSKDNLTIKL